MIPAYGVYNESDFQKEETKKSGLKNLMIGIEIATLGAGLIILKSQIDNYLPQICDYLNDFYK